MSKQNVCNMLKFVFFDLSLENFGVQLLSNILKNNNYDPVIIYKSADTNNLNKDYFGKEEFEATVKEVIDCKPDIVGFSVYVDIYQICRKIARMIKQINPDITIIYGGIHTTLTKESILEDDFVDFAIIGEGEEALIEFLEEFQTSKRYDKIKNLCYKKQSKIVMNPLRPYIRDLDSLPFLDKSIYFENNDYLRLRYSTMASRGCFFRCTYCANNHLHDIYDFESKHVRFRSPENVIQELVEAKKAYNYSSVFMLDDIFTFNLDWLNDFSKLYANEINLPLDCRVHPSFVTKEIADVLKKMNTKRVSIGIQTADENLRKTILGRHESNKKISHAIDLLRKNRIDVAADHIMGLPDESLEGIAYSIDCYSKWGCTEVGPRWLAYYPNTAILDIAIKKGILDSIAVEKINKGLAVYNHNTLGQFDDDKLNKMYIKYHILMSCVGLFPYPVIKFLLNNLYLILPIRFFSLLAHLISLFFVHPQPWVKDYSKLVLKNKFRRIYYRIKALFNYSKLRSTGN